MSSSKKIDFSIIILCYNQLLEATRPCLESIIKKKNNYSFELIIVDNNSQDNTANYLSEFKNNHSEIAIRLILNETNKGYAEGNNDGIKVAVGDYLILLNNDTLVTDYWLDRFYNHLSSHKSCGLVGPITNNAGTEQKIKIAKLDEFNYQEIAAPYLEKNRKLFFQTKRLSFFCVGFRSKLISEIGLLDPKYSIGMFEDDDYCMRVLLAGKTLDVIEDCFIFHKGSVSFKKLAVEKYHELFERNREYYCSKFNTTWSFSDVAVNYFAKIESDITGEFDGDRIKENIKLRMDDIADLLNIIKNKEESATKIQLKNNLEASGLYVDNSVKNSIFDRVTFSLRHYGILDTLKKIISKIPRVRTSVLTAEVQVNKKRAGAKESCFTVFPYDVATPIKSINIVVEDKQYLSCEIKVKFSIVTTVYNEAKNIESFLDSIRVQGLKAHEIIVVDGGSTDGTCELLHKYAQNNPSLNLKVVPEKGCNISKGRNIGIQLASNENIILTDAGTRMTENFCISLLAPMELDSGIDLVSGITIPRNETPANWIAKEKDYDNYTFQDFLPSARGVAIKKSIFNKIKGGFPEYLTKTGEDTLFMVFYRSLSNKWMINKAAKIVWDAPDSLDNIIKLKQSYAYGDGESCFGDWFYPQIARSSVRLTSYLSGKMNRPQVERRRGISHVEFIFSKFPFEKCSNDDMQLTKELISKNRKVFYIQESSSQFNGNKIILDFDFTLFEIYHIDTFDFEDVCFLYKDFKFAFHDNLKIPKSNYLINGIRTYFEIVNT